MGNTPSQTEREHSLRRNLESWALTSGRSTALIEDKAGASLLFSDTETGCRFLSLEAPYFTSK